MSLSTHLLPKISGRIRSSSPSFNPLALTSLSHVRTTCPPLLPFSPNTGRKAHHSIVARTAVVVADQPPWACTGASESLLLPPSAEEFPRHCCEDYGRCCKSTRHFTHELATSAPLVLQYDLGKVRRDLVCLFATVDGVAMLHTASQTKDQRWSGVTSWPTAASCRIHACTITVNSPPFCYEPTAWLLQAGATCRQAIALMRAMRHRAHP